MKKILSTILLALIATTAMAQESLTYAYATRNSQISPYGTGRVDVYDVAIAINNPSVYDMAITSIEFPVFPDSEIETFTAWISTSLRLEQQGSVKVNVPDVVFEDYEVDYEDGDALAWIKFNLDEPFIIPEGGVYVGYTFSIDKASTDATKYPIAATQGTTEGSLYLHTTRTYKSWADRSTELNATSLIQVELRGTSVPPNAARLGAIPKKYVAIDQDNTIGVMVYNIGTEPISSLDYSVTIDNEMPESFSMTLDTPINPVFGSGTEVDFALPNFSEEGTRDISLQLTAINGEPFDGAAVHGKVFVALFIPKHNALVEEYTGMWCGNCPRGFVAMEYMNENYPDFIGIAYHNRDALEMETGDPGLVDGYPMVSLERKNSCDPYYADPTSNLFSLPDVWQSTCAEFTPVEVEVEAQWDEETHTVSATSTVNWAIIPEDAETANYRLEYVLLADGLSDPNWYQTNYYANGANGYPEYMDEFTNGESYVFGLVYNDCAMQTSGFKGIKGSIPEIRVGEPTTHIFTFSTDDAYNSSGVPFPFDKEHLRVVAMVLKGAGSGTVVNAAKCDVLDDATSFISLENSDPEINSIDYFDLSGRKQTVIQKGVFIQVTHRKDGTTITKKIIL